MRVTIAIPTFRRLPGLKRAVRSAFAQRNACEIEIVCVDNSPEHGARAMLEDLAREAQCDFQWRHERRAGVAHARNALMAMATGEFIAWLDDDEEAPDGWLAALIAAQAAHKADVVFGPVRAFAPTANPRAYYEQLYARTGPVLSGPIQRSFGIGNSLTRRALLAPFDASANETGGEDDLQFALMREKGASFAWAADAQVIEHVDGARLRFGYALKRAFAYGQGPCETASATHHYLTLARHMTVGAAQASLFGAGFIASALMGSPQRYIMADRAARGLGKVLWFLPQKFYGAAA